MTIVPSGSSPSFRSSDRAIASPQRSYGWVLLADKLGAQAFTAEDERLLSIYAAQAGRIYENGSLYKKIKQTAEQLEIEVEERRRAAQELIGSLDQGIELTQGTTSYVWLGGRFVRGWAVELLLVALLVPFLVGVVDLFAHCRRRRIPLLAAGQSLRSRVGFWLFAGVAFVVFRAFGAWPTGVPRPPNPETAVAGAVQPVPMVQ